MNEPLFGIEEEVFLTYPDRPALDALWPLARLLWRNPRYYYTRSASNFARGADLRRAVMSGVELSTPPRRGTDAAVAALAEQRRRLAEVADAYIVPMGSLLGLEARTNTCGLHVHIGGVDDLEAAYAAVAHFLPLLACAFLNAPYDEGGQPRPSFRFARSYAIGPLRADPRYRFQDLILPYRLPTVEIRCFDPVWETERLATVLRAISAVLRSGRRWPLDRDRYNRLRAAVAEEGYGPHVRPLFLELSELITLPEALFAAPPAEAVRRWAAEDGVEGAYRQIDAAYRGERGRPRPREVRPRAWRAAAGFLAYYVPRLPYTAWKAFVERPRSGGEHA